MASFRATLKFQPFLQGLRGEEDDDDELADWKLPLCFTERRHTEKIAAPRNIAEKWRMKERMKTVSVALVLCLNVGVDPPDVVKPSPCARTETWIDPLSMSPQKALEAVGNNLQRQYERWQPKARYKQSLDPTTDDVKKLCTSLRRNAKEERVLFHYNGHAVPKPTTNGEIWVFNKSYTQYIPLSLYDLQTWMGSPSIYVWDCNTAGVILDTFNQFARQRRDDHLSRLQMRGAYIPGSTPTPPDPLAVRNYIQLAACGSEELLPMNSQLPADLFTSCLTTPIKTALRLYILQKTNRLRPRVTVDLVDKIPGRLNDRRTPLGELNWIFTAITDTIAWNTLPRDLFHQLFRQDLLVASLFRNFLLADRIMRTYNCTPKSTPSLPTTHQHSLWQAWDLALDLCLPQIAALLEGNIPYQSSPFFTEQLTAFQVWLALGSNDRQPPEQLPIVLQVLLSQVHRVRALELLGKFLDMGPWAVNEALSVGIFPYVLKLLQSTARELRHLLVFVWAKILAVDSTCQSDLVKDGTHRYFLSVLCDHYMAVEHRIHAAFVLSQIVSNHIQGQEACLKGNLIATCLEQLLEPHPLLRQWLAICLGRIWRNYEDAKWVGVRDSAHEKLFCLLGDLSPEVRTAAVFALGTFIGVGGERNDQVNGIDNNVASRLLGMATDGSPLVREELVIALHGFVTQFESTFMSVAARMQEDERQKEENAQSLQGISTSVNPIGDWVMVHTDYASSSAPHSDPTSTQPGELGSSPTQKASVLRATSASELQAIKETKPMLRASSATAVPPAKTSNSTSVAAASSSSSSLGSSNSSPSTFGDFLRRSPMFGFNSVYINTWKMLGQLALDPCHSVSVPARSIVDHISHRAANVAQPQRCRGSTVGSHSAPSSPTMQRRTVAESVPDNSVTDVQIPASEPAMHPSKSLRKSSLPKKSSLTVPCSQQFAAKRRIFGRGPSKHSDNSTIPTSLSTSSIQETPPQQQQQQQQLQGGNFPKTQFCEWSSIHFTRLSSKVHEMQDIHSEEYQEQQEKYKRNSWIRRKGALERRRAETCRLDDQVLVHKNPHSPTCLRFHPYNSQLIVGERSGVSVWDWEEGSKMYTLTANQPREARITTVDIVNAHNNALLLTGSDDGSVRIWRSYTSDHCEIASAWKALSDRLPSTKGSGLVLQWEQQSSLLFASGDVKHVVVWDAEKEQKVQEIATGAESCVTSLATDEAGRSLLIAGFGDGSVRLFDRRSPTGECMVSSHVMTLNEHRSWIVNVFVQTGRDGKIISGSVDGEVKLWDPRFSESVQTIMTSAMLSALDLHPNANIFASGSPQNFIKIYNLSGSALSTIRYHDGFMGQRIGPIACLAFHPYKAYLAAGSTDSYVSIYTLEKQKK